MCKHKSNWDYDQIYAKVSQNSINLLENPSNKEKIWSETSKTVCWDILLQEQYGRCSDTVYWAKNSIAHHPCKYWHGPWQKFRFFVKYSPVI